VSFQCDYLLHLTCAHVLLTHSLAGTAWQFSFLSSEILLVKRISIDLWVLPVGEAVALDRPMRAISVCLKCFLTRQVEDGFVVDYTTIFCSFPFNGETTTLVSNRTGILLQLDITMIQPEQSNFSLECEGDHVQRLSL
jgi:hypothetical protein